MSIDEYKTIKGNAQGAYSEKRSKFLAFSFHVETIDEIKQILDDYRKKYYDARHVCYAYMLGPKRLTFRSQDDGEPSGTAGKPILGQINSNSLTDILIIVVRYFGGIKLGTSGLIQAYKAAAQEAIKASEIEILQVKEIIDYSFPYEMMNDVMRVIKQTSAKIVLQEFGNTCQIKLSIRSSLAEDLKSRLERLAFE